MIYRKILTALICFLFAAVAIGQTKPADGPKKVEISDELREKANALINSLAQEADQFYLPENRVNARLLVGNLLWESNERQARQLFQNAVAELDTLIGQILAGEIDKDADYLAFYNISNLRMNLLLQIAGHDPAMALNALQSLSRKMPDGTNVFDGDEALELQLAAEIVSSDPKQAYELALKRLDDNNNYTILDTLEAIYKKDEDLGAKLARDILGRIKSKSNDSVSNPNRVGNSVDNSGGGQSGESGINVWEVKSFYDKVSSMNRQAARAKKKPVLSEADRKDLLELLARKYITQQYLGPYEVSGIMSELDRSFPALAQAIRRRMDANGPQLDDMSRGDDFQAEIEDKPLEEIIKIVERKPAAHREELFQKAAEAAFAAGDIIGAKELYSRVKTRPEYDYLGTEIENQLPLALAAAGNIGEVRQALADVESPEGKIEILTALAGSLLAKGEVKPARQLVDEARSLYSGRMKSRNNLASVLQLSQVLVSLEPEQGFSFLENNMSFVNDVIAAGILIQEFNDTGDVKSDEVLLSTVESESYRNVSHSVALIRSLAKADFDRTAALADRLARREPRFFARFRIAQALLDSEAETIEQNFTRSFESEHGDGY